MAKKRPYPDVEEPWQWVEPSEVEEALAGLPKEGSVIYLYRVNDKTRRKAFLEKLDPGEFDLAEIKRKFGGGLYNAIGKEDGEATMGRYFEIDGPPVVQLAALAPPPPAVDPGLQAKIATVETAIGKQQDLLGVVLKELMTGRGAPTFDEDKFLDRLTKYKALLGAGSAPAGPVAGATKEIFDIVEKVIGMTNLGGGESNAWLTAASQFREPIVKTVDAIHAAVTKWASQASGPPASGTPAAPAALASPLPASASSHVEPPAAPTGVLERLKALLPVLINGAKNDTDPGVYVALVLDQVPAPAYPELHTWLVDAGCLEQLAAFEPGIRFQQQWWADLRRALLDALLEELRAPIRRVQPPEDPESSAGAPGASPASPGAGEGAGH